MPIYIYECKDCFETWKETHSMTDTIEDCFWCDSNNIHRKPSNFNNLYKKQPDQQSKVGVLTNEFIENSKEELKQQKQELDKNR